MPSRLADRNLLVGVQALNMGLITREALMAALRTWLSDKQRPLGEILVAQGALADDERALLEPLIDRHIAQHQGDVQQSLAAVSSLGSVRVELAQIPDDELQASLAQVSLGATEASSGSIASLGTPSAAGTRFRILRLQDKGGMGVVWMAQDAELPRQVAVKEIKPEYVHDEGTRQRFQLEAEITGGLEHPGIVPVYGLGTFDDGRPFYVMRFIRGDSLKDAIARFHAADADANRAPGERSLALRDLLQRFIDVCNAIEYAHQRGILHRDLKPGNVMVGRYGETLVVDWGLAKVIGRQDVSPSAEEKLVPPSASGSELTMQGPIGTLQYMSPEQALDRQDLLGKSSDVYGLGAILYVLLTGKPPRPSADRDVALEQARRGEFVPTRSANSRAAPALAAICEKALAPEADRRYASAAALADEIKHWLADEPVGAWREPVLTRLARWARRHRTLVSGAAAALLVSLVGLAVGLAVLGTKNEQLRVARDAAEANAVRAQNNAELAERRFRESKKLIDDWFTGVSESRELKNAPGLQPLRKKLLERAQTYYQQAAQEQSGDLAVQADAAAAWSRLGVIVGDIASKEEAEKAHRQALGIRESLARDDPRNVQVASDLAVSHHYLGRLLFENGRLDEAQKEYEAAKSLRDRLAADNPQSPQHARDLATTRNALGQLYITVGRVNDAQREYQSVVELRERVATEMPDDPQAARDLAMIHQHLGALLAQTARTDEALPHFTRVNEVLEKAVADHPNDSGVASELGVGHHNLALLLSMLGRSDEALKKYEQAREVQSRLAQENPAVDAYAYQLSMTHANLGILLSDVGRSDEALHNYQTSAAVRERLVREHPTVTNYALTLANSYDLLAVHYSTLNRPAEALEVLDKGILMVERLSSEQPALLEVGNVLASSLLNRGAALTKLGRNDEALQSYERCAQEYQRIASKNPGSDEFASGLAKAYSNSGALLFDLGRIDDAEQHFRSALAVRERLSQANPTLAQYQANLASTHDDLGNCHMFRGRLPEATTEHQKSAELYRKLVEQDPSVTLYASGLARSLFNLGQLQAEVGQAPEALEACNAALEIRERLAKVEPDSVQYARDVAQSHEWLGDLSLDSGEPTNAEAAYRRALEIRQRLVQDTPDSPRMAEDLGQTQARLGRLALVKNLPDEAGPWVDKAIETFRSVTQLSPEALVNLAGAHCLRIELSSLTGEETAREEHGSAAVEALRKAASQGYSRERIRTMEVLAPLRERDDFKALLAEPSDSQAAP